MAATVSCQDIKVSDACNATSNALDVPSVIDAEKLIVKGGCTSIVVDPKSDKCTFTDPTYSCKCEQTLTGTNAWEGAVRNISNGLPCYLDVSVTLTGTLQVDNTTTKSITMNTTQTNFATLAVGGNCTQSDIQNVFATTVAQFLPVFDTLNANSASSGITWTTGTASVNGCGVQRNSAVVNIPPPSAGGTTAPPSVTTAPPSGTTAPPTSTGKSGASVVASSAALVASLVAAVAILA